MRPILPFVETMITQVCNLSCRGCTNYSDLTHAGIVTWEQGCEDLTRWLTILDIPDFGIIGGEPLINPQVRKWIQGSRDLMPTSQIRFTTNGLLLDKHFDIVDLLSDIGNSVLKITVHLEDSNLEQTINRIFNRYKFKPVTEYGINRWACESFKFQINRPTKFVKSYKGTYETMLPYNSNPEDAFSNCCQQTCPLLYQGNIHKCSTSALLQQILTRFNHTNEVAWESFINNSQYYVSPNSSAQELIKFIENFGRANSVCRMCPSTGDSADIDHQKTVIFK